MEKEKEWIQGGKDKDEDKNEDKTEDKRMAPFFRWHHENQSIKCKQYCMVLLDKLNNIWKLEVRLLR